MEVLADVAGLTGRLEGQATRLKATVAIAALACCPKHGFDAGPDETVTRVTSVACRVGVGVILACNLDKVGRISIFFPTSGLPFNGSSSDWCVSPISGCRCNLDQCLECPPRQTVRCQATNDNTQITR